MVVLQTEPRKEPLSSVGSDVVIELCDISVEFVGSRRGKRESLKVVAVAQLIGIRLRVLIQSGDDVWIDAPTPRTSAVPPAIEIHGSNLWGAQRIETRSNVHTIGHRIQPSRIHALNLLSSARTHLLAGFDHVAAGIQNWGTLILDNSLPQ